MAQTGRFLLSPPPASTADTTAQCFHRSTDRAPILITQHGLPAAYLVDVETYERQQKLLGLLWKLKMATIVSKSLFIAKLRRSVLLAATQKIVDEIDNPQEPVDDEIIVSAKQVA